MKNTRLYEIAVLYVGEDIPEEVALYSAWFT